MFLAELNTLPVAMSNCGAALLMLNMWLRFSTCSCQKYKSSGALAFVSVMQSQSLPVLQMSHVSASCHVCCSKFIDVITAACNPVLGCLTPFKHDYGCCSEFNELKALQSSLAGLAQAEAAACKCLIDGFSLWYATNYGMATQGISTGLMVSRLQGSRIQIAHMSFKTTVTKSQSCFVVTMKLLCSCAYHH